MTVSRFLGIVLALTVASSASIARQHPPPTPEREQLEEMARRATERIRVLQREADTLAAQEQTLLTELRQLEVQRRIQAEEVSRLEIELQRSAQELEATTARVQALEQAVVDEQPDIAARLVTLYKLGPSRYARLLFDVDGLRAFGRAYRLVSALAALDRRRIAAHRATLDALRAEAKTLAAKHDQTRSLQAEARGAREDLDRAVARHTRLVRSIDSRRDLTAQLIGELQGAQQRLQASLAELANGQTPSVVPVALPLRSFRGDLAWPVSGRVTTRFGRHRQSRFGTTIVRNGIEIATEQGTAVAAAHPGLVAFAATFTGFGNLVILDHGHRGYTLYGYLDSVSVETGARVKQGTPVGTSGFSPTGTSALYFEVRIDGEPVDPLQWLKPR